MTATMNATVADRVRALIALQLGANAAQLTDTARLISDLGADDLDHLEIILAIEDEFGIQVPDEQTDALSTVGEMVAYVCGVVQA